MKYNHIYTIKYQDVDDTRKLRLYTLEDYLLEVAGKTADSLGFGTKVLYPRKQSWILTNMTIEMQEMPTQNDVVRFETWIEGNAHMLSVRDYRIYIENPGEESKQIGAARSVWAVLDLEKREIVNIFDDPMFEGSIDGEKVEIGRAQRIRALQEFTQEEDGKVEYSDLDYNGHCNSCKYVQKMMNIKRADLSKPIHFDLVYSKEVYEGEKIRVGYLAKEDGSVQYQITNEKGELSCGGILA